MVGYLKCVMVSSHGHNHDDVQPSSDTTITTNEDSASGDMETVKGYIIKDCLKEYAFSLSDEQGTQLSKQQCFESIEILFKESTRGGGMHSYVYICTYMYTYKMCI